MEQGHWEEVQNQEEAAVSEEDAAKAEVIVQEQVPVVTAYARIVVKKHCIRRELRALV